MGTQGHGGARVKLLSYVLLSSTLPTLWHDPPSQPKPQTILPNLLLELTPYHSFAEKPPKQNARKPLQVSSKAIEHCRVNARHDIVLVPGLSHRATGLESSAALNPKSLNRKTLALNPQLLF